MNSNFKLSQNFLKQYQTKKPPFGFNGLGELTYMRTYSRIKQNGKNEVWWETIKRVVEGTYSMQKRHIYKYNLGWSEQKAQRSAQEMYDRMFNMKFLPPGRGLWAMGTDLTDKRGLYAALNNCFASETEILTKDGIKKIGEVVGTIQQVLTHKGNWVDAPIRSFGKQKLYSLVLRRGKKTKTIRVTGDHRWVFKQLKEKKTTQLKVGDKIPYQFEADNPSVRPNRSNWSVVSVEETEDVEEVFCATVDGYGTFTLADNLLTGNCAFVSTENIGQSTKESTKPFEFLMDMSMLGVGVGFDVKGEKQIKIQNPKKQGQFIIPDTREGWVQSVAIILTAFFQKDAPLPIFDVSQLRKKGTPIKTFGGVASGPKPLQQLHQRLIDLFSNREGELITKTDIVDIMNMIGCCVVAGNVRRTAEIVFGPHDDQEYLKLKDYKFDSESNKMVGSSARRSEWGWTSNNSIFAQIGQDYTEVGQQTAVNGEPGYAWLDNMQKYGRMVDSPNWKDKRAKGGNPSLRKGTLVLTDNGIVPIEQLEEKSFKVKNLNGDWSDAKCFLSGKDKELYKISFSGRRSIYATPEHEWPVLQQDGTYKKKRTDQLDINDRFKILQSDSISFSDKGTYDQGLMIGWLVGDGWITFNTQGNKYECGFIFDQQEQYIGQKIVSVVNQHKQTTSTIKSQQSGGIGFQVANQSFVDQMINDFGCYPDKQNGIPKSVWNYSDEYIKGFIDGLFSSDGDVDVYSKRINLTTSREKIANDVVKLLSFYGIKANIRKGSFPNKKDYNKTYTSYTVSISGYFVEQFRKIFTLSHTIKQSKIQQLTFDFTYKNSQTLSTEKVVDVELTQLREDVWDITVYDKTHTFQCQHVITGNCLEQTLESFELCCLVETFPDRHQDLQDYLRTLKFAYLYAKTVTLGKTHWSETNRVMLRNRRIGTSQSGIVEFIENRGIDNYQIWCDQGYKTIQKYDEVYSDWLCIPKSIKTTSIKPSGTVSLLPGVPPGMHYPESNYHIRRIRISEQSQLIQRCIDAGYHVERDVVNQDTMVIEVPVKMEGIRTVDQVSLWEQMSLAAFIQKWWADNQVSCTVTFNKHEADQIPHALKYFQYQLKGISFLPKLDQGKATYAQMPYEDISKQTYLEKVKGIKPLDFTGLGEDSIPEKYCDSDSCTV